jgi:predicted molibdopterin-dependent oxidoreductase YjgC
MFLTEAALFADVVLPTSCGPEKNGTFTNTDRRVQRVRKAINSPGETRDDWRIIADLSAEMGYPADYSGAMDITEEISNVVPFYSGIKPERIENDGLHWPCPRSDHPGTEVLHENRFPSGLGRVRTISGELKKKVSANYPYVLVPGLLLYHSGTTTTKAKGLNEIAPIALAEINPADARDLEVKSGDWVRLTSMKGIVDIKVLVSERSQEGTIFAPTHYRGTPVNALLSYDPVKEKSITYISVEKIEKFEGDERTEPVEGQVTRLRKIVKDIQKKRREAHPDQGPDASGG